MDSIPFWFKYPHCIIFVFLIFLPYFIYQVFKNAFTANAGVKHSKNKGIVLKYSCFTKYFLLVSVIMSYFYVITTSIQSSLMWVTFKNHKYIIGPSIWCPLFASFRMFSYVTGRSLLYCYFIYRTNDIFNGTYLQFTKYSKYALVSYIYFVIITLVAGSSFIYFFIQSWSIITDNTNHGTYCKSDDEKSEYVRYLFMWGSVNDITYSIITIFMMVSRLFLLLTDNERKKSRSKRYEYSSKDCQRNIEIVPTEPPSPAASPPDSPRAITATHDHQSPFDSALHSAPNSAPNSRRNSIENPSEIPQIVPQNTATNTSFSFGSSPSNKSGSESKERKKSKKLKRVVTISKFDAIQFHDKTHGHNKVILLISKFFIILTCVVVSSQLVLCMFIIFRDYVQILYSLDTIINIICLWLSFNFSDDLYNKYFCGRCCTQCCFPCIKTITLTCDQYERQYQQSHNMNNKCIASKWTIYCKCCCFASCRYCCCCCCCCSNNATPKEIYTLAKYEIELMVNNTKENTITMSQLSQNQSQKDVMVQQINTQKSIDNEQFSYAE